MQLNDQSQDLIYSYLTLRKAVGWIGILLPFTLLLGTFLIFKGETILPSISDYYYTGMRDVFVGAICAIALFLFFYKGYDDWDKWIGNITGFFAIGLAFFPTAQKGTISWIGTIHFMCAALFFLTLAGFSMFLFTKKGLNPTKQKLLRNKIYILCGLVMIVCLIAIGIFFKFSHSDRSSFVFWAETVALIAFGISWLTKGGTLFTDKEIR